MSMNLFRDERKLKGNCFVDTQGSHGDRLQTKTQNTDMFHFQGVLMRNWHDATQQNKINRDKI